MSRESEAKELKKEFQDIEMGKIRCIGTLSKSSALNNIIDTIEQAISDWTREKEVLEIDLALFEDAFDWLDATSTTKLEVMKDIENRRWFLEEQLKDINSALKILEGDK